MKTMPQAYSAAFARVYNQAWAGFANRHAPLLRAFYEQTPIGQTDRSVLDVCCGTGQLAAHFLEHGYRVAGIDLSEPMLEHARTNCRPYVESGQARFIQADASGFEVDGRFGLAVSTYDALNHLPDLKALAGCFRSAHAAVADGGWLIFDLNTVAGLRRWNALSVTETEALTLIQRGVFDEPGGRAYALLSGFLRGLDGRHERFEETAYNTAFDLGAVQARLAEAGWRDSYYADAQDLSAALGAPEEQGRVFAVAHK
jgi:SAM-dependent methyltransferase